MEEEVKALRCSLWTTWVAVLEWNLTTCKINGQPNNSNQVLVLEWTKDQGSETVIWGAEEVTLVVVKTLSTQTISLAIWVPECKTNRCNMAKGKVDNVKCRIPPKWTCRHLNRVTDKLTIHLWEEHHRMACPQEICLVVTSPIRGCFQGSNSNRTSWAKDLTWDSNNKTQPEETWWVDSKIWWWTSSKIRWWVDNNSGTATSNMGGLLIWRTISWTRES